jgi:hypothetical protein
MPRLNGRGSRNKPGTGGSEQGEEQSDRNHAMDADLRLLFPMSDSESARFMRVKARCLRRAGVLDSAQHQVIQQRVERLLTRSKSRAEPARRPESRARTKSSDVHSRA